MLTHIGKIFIVTLISTSTCLAQEALPDQLNPMFWHQKFSKVLKPVEISPGPSANSCQNFYRAACEGMETAKENNWPVTPIIQYFSDRSRFEQQRTLLLEAATRWSQLPTNQRPTKKVYLINEAVEKFGYRQKLKRWRRLFKNVQKDAKTYFRKNAILVPSLIDEISLSDNYQAEPSMIFTPNVTPRKELLVGGGLLEMLNNDTAIYYVLAHELGHILSGELNGQKKSAAAYSCMKNEVLKKDLRSTLSTMEIEAEWFAHQLVSIRLNHSRLSHHQKEEELKNSVRLFCGFSTSGSRHPSGPQRIHYFSHNPVIQQFTCSSSETAPPLSEDKFPVRCY